MTWARTNGGDFQDPPVGTHLARCIGLIDLGTQKEEYDGKTSIKRKNIIKWELPETLMDDGRPFVVSKWYTTSLSDKATLYADLVNWRGKEFTKDELAGFDEKNLLDKVCMVSITTKVSGKVGVTAIMGKPKSATPPPRVNDLLYFSLEPDRFNRAVFDGLSEKLQDIIRKSPEWAEANGQATRQPGEDFEDDTLDF